MATFSYQHHHPFLLDSAYLLNGSVKMSHEQVGDVGMTNASSCFPCYYSANAITEFSPIDANPHESSSSFDSTGGEFVENQGELSVAAEQLQNNEVISKSQSSSEKERKERNRVYSSSAQTQDAKEGKGKKQKKCSAKEAKEEPSKADEGGKKARQEPPSGYIHVRARRGQATDSHSLAERVRREKISERMKLLQGLVPGCDKVTGKALMLDEIINYVQSLQNQVEFLSMKLASVNPTLYDFGLDDLEDCMAPQEKLESMSPPALPSVQQASHIQPTAFPATTNNYPTLDTSSSFLLHGQGPSTSSSQDHGSFGMQVGDHTRQAFLNQVVFNNIFSFH